MEPFVANTDEAWFEFLSRRAAGGRLDEVNFWHPKAPTPMKRMAPGTPVFFRLKQPHHVVAGYGFFAHFIILTLDEAWRMFGEGNGDPNEYNFLVRIGRYRGANLLTPSGKFEKMGCTVLRDAVFWSRERWIPWGEAEGWGRQTVRGATATDPARAARLLAEIAADHAAPPPELGPTFDLVETDDRRLIEARQKRREGQGAFRARLLTAYDGACAITTEHTQPVLEAAHIQPYLGPRSNHVQNGILVCQEFHTLLDLGYLTITPEHRVRVSRRLDEDFHNGRRYFAYDDQPLRNLPAEQALRPSPRVLAWHNEHVFRA